LPNSLYLVAFTLISSAHQVADVKNCLWLLAPLFALLIEPQRSPLKLQVNVDRVQVYATVTNDRGNSVSGIPSEYFHVWENDVEQTIERVTAEDVPMSIGIALDTSASMRHNIDVVRRAAMGFLQMGTRSDEYFLLEFSGKPDFAVDFTTDVTRLETQLLSRASGGRTALFDAMKTALMKVREGTKPRKILLVMSDGSNNRSKTRCQEVLKLSRETDAQIYWIRISTGEPFGTSNCELEDIVASSGGRMYLATIGIDLVEICARIAQEIQYQYVIVYAPSNTARDGKYRRLRVALELPPDAPRLYVRAKQGYTSAAY
jgi:VWFA-related protein